jgi:hypothetical protein
MSLVRRRQRVRQKIRLHARTGMGYAEDVTNRFFRDAAAIVAASFCCACSPDPIEWSEAAPLASDLKAAPALAFDARHQLVAGPAAAAPALPAVTGQCRGSIRVARDATGEWYAVWWSVRADSTADLLVSRSADGTHWNAPVNVDATDVGRIGCARPSPSIVADRDNVHVAYAMAAKEGPGIFASHSMDRAMTFHSPVAVVYGERLGLTAVAARGDVVAVAYEDPNTNPQRVGLAFSRTMGHPFETRQLVSPPTGAAGAPELVLGDGRVAVTWRRGADASAPRIARVGTTR